MNLLQKSNQVFFASIWPFSLFFLSQVALATIVIKNFENDSTISKTNSNQTFAMSSMYQVTTVFKALSDPIRVEMVHRLSKGDSFNLSTISTDLGVTRQGARKHLMVLEKARLIDLYKEGRSTNVRLNKDSLDLIQDFIAKLEHQWDERLCKLRTLVEEIG